MRSDYTMSQLPTSLLPADNWYQYLQETENHGESLNSPLNRNGIDSYSSYDENM